MNRPGIRGGLLLVLAACGAPPPDADSDALAAGTDTPSAQIATVPAGGQDSARSTKDTARLLPIAGEWTVGRTAARITPGGIGILRSVRQARHDGFDRVVFEFGDGSAVPGYELAYVDSPQHQCASGEEVRLKGRAWLSVKLQPAQAHDDAGNATVRERSREPGFPNLLELRLTCDFEAHVEWIAGVARRNGYRLVVLREPARLVLDIKH